MRNLVLLSVVIASLMIPILSALSANSRRGFLRAVSIAAAFNLFYLLLLLYVYPHLN
jgi:hypothetical protein